MHAAISDLAQDNKKLLQPEDDASIPADQSALKVRTSA
jgi:hypothetical protein